MKLTIEVVADELDEAIQLGRDALREAAQGRAKSGEVICSNTCLGDYRLIVEEPLQEPAFSDGQRVECIDNTHRHYGNLGRVQHSGPSFTGVRFDGAETTTTLPNAALRPANETWSSRVWDNLTPEERTRAREDAKAGRSLAWLSDLAGEVSKRIAKQEGAPR